jgi:hypothetical protein
VSTDCAAYTHTENHDSLLTNNLLYANLTVMQRPSWVCPPSSYIAGSVLSISVAFEDPDGSKLKTLLAECYLYIHGYRATICKWKQCKPIPKDTATQCPKKHDQNRVQDNTQEEAKERDDKSVKLQFTPKPRLQEQDQTVHTPTQTAQTDTTHPQPAQKRCT